MNNITVTPTLLLTAAVWYRTATVTSIARPPDLIQLRKIQLAQDGASFNTDQPIRNSRPREVNTQHDHHLSSSV